MKTLNEMMHIKYLALCPIHMLNKYQLLSLCIRWLTICLAKVFKIKLPSESQIYWKGTLLFSFIGGKQYLLLVFHEWENAAWGC